MILSLFFFSHQSLVTFFFPPLLADGNLPVEVVVVGSFAPGEGERFYRRSVALQARHATFVDEYNEVRFGRNVFPSRSHPLPLYDLLLVFSPVHAGWGKKNTPTGQRQDRKYRLCQGRSHGRLHIFRRCR